MMDGPLTSRPERSAGTGRASWRVGLGALLATVLAGTVASETMAEAPVAKRFAAFEWDLDLPERPVSRRISRHFSFKGEKPTVLADIDGPGCIRRFWITGNNIGRDVVLRIYFDGQPVPYVEAPLTDFFGAMHNLMADPYPHDHSRRERPGDVYVLNTPFLAIKPKSGMTAYFAMPFATNARFEVTGSERSTGLYYTIDWHDYPGQQMTEPMRFAARWRRESPVRDYADEFILLDADGPGQLIGFIHSVDMLQSRQIMRWSHAGADNIYIDGEGAQPAHLRGIGGEDTFGTSYSGGDYLPQTSLFSDMPFYVQKDPEGDRQKLVGYRFFVHEAIHFEKSLHLRFAARAHDLAAMAYWYTARPVRPYFEMPPREQRLPGSEVRRGRYDLPLPDSGQWWIAGPFAKGRFEHELPTGAEFDPAQPLHGCVWRKFAAIRGFVDFNHVYRPPPSNANSPALDAVAVARATLVAPADTTATLTLAWDDQLVLRVNDGEPIDLGAQAYVRAKTIQVPLRRGENTVALWLSNEMGLTRGTWVFSFRAVTDDGEVLLAQAPGEPLPEPTEAMKEVGPLPRDQRSSSSLRGVGSAPVPFFHRLTASRVEPGRLLAHWKLDETSGRSAADAAGNGHVAMLAPGMTDENWTEGRLDGAVRLDGKRQYVQVAGPLAWADLDRVPFSLAAWIRTTEPGTQAVIYRKAHGENPKFELDIAEGRARFRLRNRAGIEFRCDSDGPRVADGQWHHLAGVKDTGFLRLYVDGRCAASLALPDDAGCFTTDHPAYWHIGSCVTGAGFQLMNFFAGQIDDVRIYSKALDHDEVARLAGKSDDTTASR
jgi:hypothetical protein